MSHGRKLHTILTPDNNKDIKGWQIKDKMGSYQNRDITVNKYNIALKW